ncbi:unnamed protein product, partial [Chrysoparadoxa australica]
MRSQATDQHHLEARPSGFYWRRRWPHAVRLRHPHILPKKAFLLFPLRTDFPQDAKTLARKLTLLSDIGFAAVLQRVEPMAPDIMETLLVELCRFQIEAADLAREMAPARSPECAEFEQRCDLAALDTLRRAVFLRDREVARNPLRAVAARLDLVLNEDDPDWQRLAMRALRAMIEAKEETMRRDQGLCDGPAVFLRAATSQAVTPQPVQPVSRMTPPAPPKRLPDWPIMSAPRGVAPVSTITPAAIPPAPKVVTSQRAQPSPAPARAAPTPSQEPAAQEKAITILQATEDYIAARTAGYSSFKRFEQPNEASGKSWAKNS